MYQMGTLEPANNQNPDALERNQPPETKTTNHAILAAQEFLASTDPKISKTSAFKGFDSSTESNLRGLAASVKTFWYLRGAIDLYIRRQDSGKKDLANLFSANTPFIKTLNDGFKEALDLPIDPNDIHACKILEGIRVGRSAFEKLIGTTTPNSMTQDNSHLEILGYADKCVVCLLYTSPSPRD